MMTDADVLVVGAGPVGLATAIEARLAGLRVTVVEPREGPIDKACGEGLMPGAVVALERLGVRVEGYDIAGIAYVSGPDRAEHRFRTGSGRGVRRTALQPALAVRAAQLGVRRVVGRVVAVEQTGRQTDRQTDGARVGRPRAGVRATVRVTAQGATAALTLTADWLVACDGLHSGIRRMTGLAVDMTQATRARFGLRRHFAMAPWSDVIEVHWTSDAEIYVTPLGPELVGVAVLGRRGVDFAQTVAASPEMSGRLDGAAAAGTLRGAGPLLQRTRRRSNGRVLLAGDASGYVDALTGEGLRVGFGQARAAVRSILADDADGYELAWTEGTRDSRLMTTGLLAAAHSPLRSRIVSTSVRHPRVFGAAVERLAR